MKPALRDIEIMKQKNKGFTLIEMLVVVAIISLIYSSVLLVFASIMKDWEREDKRTKATQSAATACERIEQEISNGVFAASITRFYPDDTLVVGMPYIKANNIYVPTWDSDFLRYEYGTFYVFYLSDETGNYSRTGNILWRSVRKSYAGETTPTIDTNWSLYYDLNKGRVSNIKAISFYVYEYGNSSNRYAVEINAVSSYEVDDEEIQVSKTKIVYLRGSPGR